MTITITRQQLTHVSQTALAQQTLALFKLPLTIQAALMQMTTIYQTSMTATITIRLLLSAEDALGVQKIQHFQITTEHASLQQIFLY
jgi:hypothetical protein